MDMGGIITIAILVGIPAIVGLWYLSLWATVKVGVKLILHELRCNEAIKYIQICTRVVNQTLEHENDESQEETKKEFKNKRAD